MNITWETALAIIAVSAIVTLTVFVMRLKTNGLAKLAINTLAGSALIAGLSAFNVIVLPFNAFTALMIGILGLPGAAVVIAGALLL